MRITNLSAGGCFALVGARDARLFERGVVLDNLVLLHPELPKAPIIAAVSYVLGAPSTTDPMEMVGIGIQFQGMQTKMQVLRVSGKIGFSNHPMLEHFRFLKANTRR